MKSLINILCTKQIQYSLCPRWLSAMNMSNQAVDSRQDHFYQHSPSQIGIQAIQYILDFCVDVIICPCS